MVIGYAPYAQANDLEPHMCKIDKKHSSFLNCTDAIGMVEYS